MIRITYNISERQTEEFTRYFLPAKYFVGLGVDQLPPDHSSLTVFKDRLLKHSGQKAVESLFDEIITQAKKRHIRFGSLQIIDSTHAVADVNHSKDQDRQKQQGKPPRDKDAAWGVKRVKPAKDKDGKTRQIPETFYGYKIHASFNPETDLITSLRITGGSAYDGYCLKPLVNKDLRKGLPIDTVAADRGFGRTEFLRFLLAKNLLFVIRVDKNVWVKPERYEACLGIGETSDRKPNQG